MSDFPQGPGWWQASDDKWYAPELHPDQQSGRADIEVGSPVDRPDGSAPKPDISSFEPPVADQRVGFTSQGVGPGATSSPGVPGAVPGPPPVGPPSAYPAVPVKKRSTGKVLAIVFGVLFLILVAGCGAFAYAFREEIADGTVDFTDSVAAGEATLASASCEVTGLRFGSTTYGVEATMTAVDESVPSHFEMSFELRGPDGELLGTEINVFRNMAPDEQRSEAVLPTIEASVPFDTTTCIVTDLVQVTA